MSSVPVHVPPNTLLQTLEIYKYKISVAVLLIIIIKQNINPNKSDCDEDEESLLLIISSRCLFLLISYIIGYKIFNYIRKEASLLYEAEQRTGKDFGLIEYIYYRLDYLYSHEKTFKQNTLFCLAITIILIGGFLLKLSTNEPFSQSIWTAWTFVSDAGTHSDAKGTVHRFVSMVITLGGVVIFAFAIGLVNDDLSIMMENLRKGKSRVIEANHTLILGQVR
jgi:hypothetical protein